MLGCYDVIASGEWGLVRSNPRSPYTQRAAEILVDDSMFYQMPSRIQLAGPPIDTMRFRGRWEITMPADALPSVHSRMSYHLRNDTLLLLFTTGYAGLAADLTVSDDAKWSGTVTTFDDYTDLEWSRRVQLTPIACELSIPGSEFRSKTSGEAGAAGAGVPPFNYDFPAFAARSSKIQ